MAPDERIRAGLSLVYCDPTSREPAARITGFQRITDGWETEVYRFDVEHADGRPADPRILRLYPADDAPRKSAHELAVLRRVRSAGYPVPEVYSGSSKPEPFGHPYLLMERIDGRPLGAVAEEADPAELPDLADRFAEMYVRLHALPWREILPDAVPPSDPHAWLRGTLDRWTDRVSGLGGEEWRPVLRWLDAHAGSLPCAEPSLLHDDFHPSNVLMTPSGAMFVIDWGSAKAGDRRADLGWTLLLIGWDRPGARDMVLAAYERHLGRPVAGIEYFEALAALRRLFSIHASLRFGSDRQGMRPEAVEAMRRSGDHCRAVYALLRERSGIELPAIEAWVEGIGVRD